MSRIIQYAKKTFHLTYFTQQMILRFNHFVVYKAAISRVLIITLLCGHTLSFFLGKYLGVGLLDCISTYFTL